jgi:RNA polymerase sigma factor (TIGR02999 family)
LTALLERARSGDSDATERVFELVQDELNGLATNMMRAERGNHTLQPTALVNEACLRLFDQHSDWAGREHFLAVAATVMRRVLIDHARRHRADKRGAGWERVTLAGHEPGATSAELDLLALDAALEKLAGLHPRQARIVEMRYLAGMTVVEVATALELSRSTIEAEWRMARAWLHRELGDALG